MTSPNLILSGYALLEAYAELFFFFFSRMPVSCCPTWREYHLVWWLKGKINQSYRPSLPRNCIVTEHSPAITTQAAGNSYSIAVFFPIHDVGRSIVCLQHFKAFENQKHQQQCIHTHSFSVIWRTEATSFEGDSLHLYKGYFFWTSVLQALILICLLPYLQDMKV